MKKYYLFLVFSCCLGCRNKNAGTIQPAFYHWQTHFQLTAGEQLYLEALGTKKIYIKFFDVDWDAETAQPVPLALAEIDTGGLAGLEIVPTVFITNRTFLNLNTEDIPGLSDRIFEKINALSAPLRNSCTSGFSSVQFDCDWSEQTKEKFFALLKYFRIKMHSPGSCFQSPAPSLSATIRLHQLKFFEKTGVPPVDRGMLMFYNMGDLEDWETENSILDLKTASLYLTNGKCEYPLPLDIALPLFRWGVLYRDGRLIKLINNLGGEDLEDSLRFTQFSPSRFEVKKSTYLQGYYLYEGDLLRLEEVKAHQLEAAARMLKPCISGTTTAAFYHLDTTTVKMFSHVQLEKVLEEFQ